MEPATTSFVPVNGLDVYYETHGDVSSTESMPLLLIPGAFLSTDSMAEWVAAFSATRPVIVFDQQGHGRTAETDRPMSYEQFGDDAAGLLRALGVDRADVMGYSQGGGVALQLALRHPRLVSKLVSLSATYRQDGWHPAVLRSLESLTADDLTDTPIGDAFRQLDADPDAFATYVEKMRVLNFEDQHITDDEMRGISARTMVIIGDADGVTPEHAVEMFRLRGGGDQEAAASGVIDGIPAARLVILPATSHLSISNATATLVPMIIEFLDDVAPSTASLF